MSAPEKVMFVAGHRIGLRRCPFCAHPASVDTWEGLDIGIRVGCGNADCPVQPDAVAPTLEMAAELWNTRADGDTGVRTDAAALALDGAAWESATRHSYGVLALDLVHVVTFKAAVQGEPAVQISDARPPRVRYDWSTAAQEGYASGLRHARRSS